MIDFSQLPRAEEAVEYVLGACLIFARDGAVTEVNASIKPEMIHDGRDRKIFEAILALDDLLLSANHEGKKFPLGNELFYCERGSFITSEVKLAKKWGWSRSKLRGFLALLENDQMIIQQKDTKKTYISICNYDDYQDNETAGEQAIIQQKNSKRTAKEQQKDTNNNDNNVNKEKSVTPPVSHEAVELGNFLLENIIKAIPTHRYSKNKPKLDRWYQDIDKAMRIDGRTPKQLRYLISYIFTQDTDRANFWKPNIQSGKKLREKFDTIAQQIKNDRKRGGYQPDTGVVFDPDDVKWMTKEEAQRDSLEYFRDPLEKTMSCYNMQTHNGKTYYKRTSE